LRPEKGRDTLKNQVFRRISKAEKRRHLRTVLGQASNGVLDEKAIERILRQVNFNRQIYVYAPKSFFRKGRKNG